jgi:translocation and assembly module TamB
MEARPGKPPDAAPASAPPPPPPRRRLARRLAAALLLPAVALLVFGAWLGASEAGLRTTVRLAGWASDGALTVEGARGRLLGTLRADAIRYHAPDLRIDIVHAMLSWRPAALVDARLQIDHLAAERIEVGRRVVDEPDTTPRAPASLALPLALELTRVELGAFALRDLDGAARSVPEAAPPAAADDPAAADAADKAAAALEGPPRRPPTRPRPPTPPPTRPPKPASASPISALRWRATAACTASATCC